MKNTTRTLCASATDRNELGLLASAALTALAGIGLLVAGAEGNAHDNRPDVNSGTGESEGSFASDDEVVGTLPAVRNLPTDALLQLLLDSEPPSFYVEAGAQELLDSILDAGPSAIAQDAFTTYDLITDPRTGELSMRLTFHGSVNVEFDSSLLEVEGVEFGLALGKNVETFGAGIVLEDRVLSTTVLEAEEELYLPLSELADYDLLERVQVLSSNGAGTRTQIEIEERGGMFSLSQDVSGPERGTGR